jgi:putative ABC transport system permease protein
VTAILVLTKSLGGLPPELTMPSVQTPINEGVVAQAVQPIRVITQFLTTFLGPLRLVLLGLTVLIVVVSAISILVSIYNSMAERRHEIAVMRALGAGRATVMQIMLLESVLLALLGGLLGWFVGHGILGALSPWLTNWTGVTFTAFHFTGAELYLIPGIIALASLVGFLPAWSAYRTDVAKALTANP